MEMIGGNPKYQDYLLTEDDFDKYISLSILWNIPHSLINEKVR